MSRRPTVAITSVRGGDAPAAGLVVAQTLARQRAIDLDIAILVTDPFVEGVQAVHLADRIVTVPPLDREPEAFVARLADLARTTSPLVLVPGSAADVMALVPHQATLRRAGVRAVLPRRAQLADLPSPRAPGVRSFPRRGRRPTGIALSAASVAAHAMPSALAVARLLDVSPSGVVWSAVTVAEPTVVAAVTRAVTRLRWRGPAETRFVLDRHGRLWFTGLTPGFPSWLSLAAAAGQDAALAYVRLALGLPAGRAARFTGGLGLSRVAIDRVTTVETLRHLVQGGIVHGTRHR
jgi:hypothetical protein